MKNITSNELIQYMYEETYLQRSLAIKMAVEEYLPLKREHAVLSSVKNSLNKIALVSPSQEVMDEILDYAKRSL